MVSRRSWSRYQLLWVGKGEPGVPSVQQKRHPSAHQLIKLHGLGIIQGEALHVRMELNALQSQLQQMLHIPLGIWAVRMQGAKGQATPTAGRRLSGQELIDVLYFVWHRGRRTQNSLGNARLSLCLQHIIQSCRLVGNLHSPVDLVKPGHCIGGFLRNGVGVYMAVKIENLHHSRQLLLTNA